MRNFNFKFYLFSLLLYQYIYSLIVLPFRINGYKPKENEAFNVTDYINKYLFVDIFTTIEIGSPPQKVTTLISPEEKAFSLSSEICKKESLDFISDYSLVSKKGLNLDNLKSYNNEFSNSKFKDYLDEHKNIGIISESIYLFNTTYLSSQPIDWKNKYGKADTKIKIDNFTMIIKDYENDDKLCGSIGIGSPSLLVGGILNLKEISSLFDVLKKNNLINSYSWTFKLYHKEEGRFIIGGAPHEYENDNFYTENRYRIINSFLPGDFIFPWSIRFDDINFRNVKNETLYIQKELRGILIPNLGFIIGEEYYKKLIIENYFNELINKKICILERTSITKFNYAFSIFEIFHCNKSIINEKVTFPKLNFEVKEKNLIFSLTFNDLFQLIEERYFFLVIFPDNYNKVEQNFWYLGLPFYKAYQLVFNFDSKTIGVYAKQLETNNDKEQQENGEIKINKEIKNNRYKRTLLEILFGALLILIAYFIGKKINEQRKKRANELIDDYEYYSNQKKDINDISNNNIKYNKGNFEMSSSIGI